MNVKNTVFTGSFLSAILLLTACGGSGGSNNSGPASQANTAQGVFLDSAVEGLRYVSGNQSGVTDAAGTFSYEVGENITFYVGEIELGSVNTSIASQFAPQGSNRVITPLDLVPDAVTGFGTFDPNNVILANILRFLQTLDDDGDTSNGIHITQTMRDLAILANGEIDFDQSLMDFANDGALQTQVSMMTAASTAGARTLIDSATAQGHFNSTLSTLIPPPIASNEIALSGSDTANVGSLLRVGDIAYNRPDLVGVAEAIIVVDEGSQIGPNFPIPGDPANTFVLVIFSDAISMTIVRGGVEYLYSCAVLAGGCGGLNFDIQNRQATLTNVVVENTQTSGSLMMNGVLQW